MVFDSIRRHFRNLMAFLVARPPCVIFVLCLACLAVALFGLGYYISHNDVVDPEAQKDWNNFLLGLSDAQFCVDDVNDLQPKQLSTNFSTSSKNKVVDVDTVPVHVSVPLKIGVSIWTDTHHLHRNITHLTSVVDIPNGMYDGTKRMNLTFSLSKVWDTGTRDCKANGKCKLQQGFFDSCVTIRAPRNLLPEWKPSTCNSSGVDMKSTMRQLSVKEQLKKKCNSGAVVYFKHPIDLRLEEKLSVGERAKANLRLQISSYFLFVLVISSLIYGLIKGRAVKTKKVSFKPVNMNGDL